MTTVTYRDTTRTAYPNGGSIITYPDGTVEISWEAPVYLLRFIPHEGQDIEPPYALQEITFYPEGSGVSSDLMWVSLYPIPEEPDDDPYCGQYTTTRPTSERVSLTPIFPDARLLVTA